MKRLSIIFFTLIIHCAVVAQANADSVFCLLKSKNFAQINHAVVQFSGKPSSSLRNACLGALFMRLAENEKTPKEKLETFKKGQSLLEGEIKLYPENVAYRLFRLIIQENAPAILKYNQQLNEDKQFIVHHYKNSEPAIQEQIIQYARVSKILTSNDLP